MLTSLTPAERVAGLVKRFGSDEKLAKRLGTTRQVVIGWRKGEHEPSRASAEKLAAVDGTPVELWLTRPQGVAPSLPDRLAAVDDRLARLEDQVKTIRHAISKPRRAQEP